MQKTNESKPSTDKNDRRRGRPAGKNRVPLSLEERRARNAQYERERRNETAEAMAQLAEAASCDPQITNPELLATVISRLQEVANRTPFESIEDMKRINNNLENQIAELENRLKNDGNFNGDNLGENIDESKSSQSESSSESESNTEPRPTKYRKIAKDSTVHRNATPVRQTSSQSSTDSQDSVWSHHYLGKTLPGQESIRSHSENIFESDSNSSMHNHRTTSESTEWRPASSLENAEVYSETFDQLEASGQSIGQQEVKMEFQLVPQEDRDVINPRVDNQSELSFMDPFTEREKGILERLGCRDFLTFDNDDEEVRDQARLPWPLDFDDFLAGF